MASNPRCTCINCGYGVVPGGRSGFNLADWDSHPYSDKEWLGILAIRYSMVVGSWMARLSEGNK